jgi:hypothetical protein
MPTDPTTMCSAKHCRSCSPTQMSTIGLLDWRACTQPAACLLADLWHLFAGQCCGACSLIFQVAHHCRAYIDQDECGSCRTTDRPQRSTHRQLLEHRHDHPRRNSRRHAAARLCQIVTCLLGTLDINMLCCPAQPAIDRECQQAHQRNVQPQHQ